MARALGVRRHVETTVDLGRFGGSALTAAVEVPKDRNARQMADGIPVTYVPARNTVLLSLALAYAEVVGSADIFLGVNAIDYSGYPDCRPEYIAAFQRLANLATKAGVEGRLQFTIHTPLIRWTKAQIIRRGVELGVDYSLTHTCYDPDAAGESCGRCDACQLRLKGFAEAGLTDPLRYRAHKGLDRMIYRVPRLCQPAEVGEQRGAQDTADTSRGTDLKPVDESSGLARPCGLPRYFDRFKAKAG